MSAIAVGHGGTSGETRLSGPSLPVDVSLTAQRLYTRAQDTLDPEDLIFPRAATRVGVKYQANVLSWEEQQAAEAYHGTHHGFVEGEAGPSRHITSAYTTLTRS
jgi:hypothetical protein